MKRKAQDEKQVTKARDAIAKGIDHIDQYFLKEQPFICGSEISAADLMGVCQLIHMTCINEGGLYENNKTVAAWINRVTDQLAPLFDEIHQCTDAIKRAFNDQTPI